MAKTLYTFKRVTLADFSGDLALVAEIIPAVDPEWTHGWVLEDGAGDIVRAFDFKGSQALGYGDGGIPFFVTGFSVETALISGDGGWIQSLVAEALKVDPDDVEVTDVRDDVHGNVFDLTTEWDVTVTEEEGEF